ncbi:23S rRNA (pseudouridine(1915)-N(3))-methyltransferase RlmH [Agaribacterium haliotis]|uniref:23S rRNA (pseudouridine(1915)-N(3))-methyltransferase RlmH n=1 Tax=Agaribacterium haliotis TaxID=2013869 RepID=UPI000BB58DC8|nr:23S rRNA (pseudouridine(1915)-N(3))-methyltransferase RlmH [Agaribacterium haliotis]
MKLSIIAVGTKMPAWVQQGFGEYEKRLPREWKPQLKELAVAKRGNNANVEKLKNQEAEQILAALPRSAHVVALDVLGKKTDTQALAKNMLNWQQLGQDIAIVIGGPDGLAERCLQRANQKLSLSDLTLPHPLVRIVLIEQLYRGWTINNGHPYHK